MGQLSWHLYRVSLNKYSCITTLLSFFQIIKYGVIGTDCLTEDLMHWKTMYVAGRLHKPVSTMICYDYSFTRLFSKNLFAQMYQTLACWLDTLKYLCGGLCLCYIFSLCSHSGENAGAE